MVSNIDVTDTAIQGVKIIRPLHVFEDHRGIYRETWNELDYDTVLGHPGLRICGGKGVFFVADDISISRRNVLRGIHGDYENYKLVSCLYGVFFLAVVDWRPDSPTYRQNIGITLSDRNYLSVLIPPGCGNGHLVLSETAIFHYKQSEYYSREGQFTIAWDDPALGIPWPISTYPILSERDSDVPLMKTTRAEEEEGENEPEMLFGYPIVYVDNDDLHATIDNISLDVSEFQASVKDSISLSLPDEQIPYKEGELFSDN